MVLIGGWIWPVFTGLLLLWVFSLYLVSQVLWRWLEAHEQLRVTTAAPRSDAIALLSGGCHPVSCAALVSDWEDPLLILAGLDLCRAGKAPRLLSTGCFSPFRPGHLPESQRYL